MLPVANILIRSITPKWENVAETVYRDLLNIGFGVQGILGEEASLWLVITIKMHRAHAEWATQPETIHRFGADSALILREPFKYLRQSRRTKTPGDKLMGMR